MNPFMYHRICFHQEMCNGYGPNPASTIQDGTPCFAPPKVYVRNSMCNFIKLLELSVLCLHGPDLMTIAEKRFD